MKHGQLMAWAGRAGAGSDEATVTPGICWSSATGFGRAGAAFFSFGVTSAAPGVCQLRRLHFAHCPGGSSDVANQIWRQSSYSHFQHLRSTIKVVLHPPAEVGKQFV